MKLTYSLLPLALLLAFCGRKTRYCECDVTDVGTKTSITTLSVPLVPAVGDTIVENYVFHTTTVAEYKKVSKKAMNASCPVKSEEPIYDRTATGVNQEGLPGVPLSVQLLSVTENKGTRTRTCKITE